jgi:hypothetical protein
MLVYGRGKMRLDRLGVRIHRELLPRRAIWLNESILEANTSSGQISPAKRSLSIFNDAAKDATSDLQKSSDGLCGKSRKKHEVALRAG